MPLFPKVAEKRQKMKMDVILRVISYLTKGATRGKLNGDKLEI